MREPNTIPDIRRLNAPNQLPTPDGYWVVPGLLLAGESPGDRMEAEARRKLRRFLMEESRTSLDSRRRMKGSNPTPACSRTRQPRRPVRRASSRPTLSTSE